LTIEPFGKLAKPTRDALGAEGEALARFLEPDATRVDVRFRS
jgi:hypothetical protein